MPSKEKMRAALTAMLSGGRVILITGNRGGGKTHLAQVLIDWFLYNGGYVLSNVIVYKKSEGTYWDDKEAYPPSYIKVVTLAQLFLRLSEIWKDNREAKILIVLDEAAVSLGAMTFTQLLAKEMTDFATLIRKFEANLILISIRPELIIKKLRSEEGLLDVRLAKEPFLLRRYAADLLRQRYDAKQIALVEWPEQGLDFVPVLIPMTKRLATPRNHCEVGGYYFDTKGAASFDPGKHPVTGKDFKFRDLVAVLGARPSNIYPDLLYRFMHEDPAPQIAEAMLGRSSGVEVEEVKIEDVEPASESMQTGKKRQVVETLRDYGAWSNAQIARECEVSREYVRQVRKECNEKSIENVIAELDRQDRVQ